MDADKLLVVEAAQEESPDASDFEVQRLGNGIFAVTAWERDPETEAPVHPERYFMALSARRI